MSQKEPEPRPQTAERTVDPAGNPSIPASPVPGSERGKQTKPGESAKETKKD